MSHAAAIGLILVLATPFAGLGVDFNREVQPILSSKCFQCHGPDESARKGKFRLDVREDVLKERNGGSPIKPGDPAGSVVIQRITTHDEDDRMPPGQFGPRLSAKEISTLTEWIREGAAYAEHWAFVAPRRPSPPDSPRNGRARNPIDRFIFKELNRARLKPAPPASREILIRRVTLDLVGLVPAPAETEAFLRDGRPEAYERLVDRLLASPHFGERWGRHWLDVSRYADSGGFETDIFFGHAWRYRDYVIQAFNRNKPYDQFIREQIAADELFPGDQDALIATGFFTTGPVLQEAGMVPGKLEYDQLTDATDTTGSAFLGLTIGCARCHDHKYDPVSQKEYFGLQAIFAPSDQFDFARMEQQGEGRAALKNTQAEFELEQLKARMAGESDPSARAQGLKKIGEYYISKDRVLAERVQTAKKSKALRELIEKYQALVRRSDSGTNAPIASIPTKEPDGEDSADASDESEAIKLETNSGDAKEQLLIEIGQRAINLEASRSPLRAQFRKLKVPGEKRAFLLSLGKANLNLPTNPDAPELSDAFKQEQGMKHLRAPSAIPVRALGHRKQPLEVRLLKRGELDHPAEIVSPGAPLRLGAPALGPVTPQNLRASLAHWIASERNPLTARVIVNRLWQGHFGQGLVRTPNDFGLRGERPTHPELLDWLAVELLESGWNLKHIHRLIVLSAAYQFSSATDPANLERDPENKLLSRFQPRRLEAEVIWDSVRAVSGTLNERIGGLPFAPPLDEQEQIGNFRKWPESAPSEVNRRAVYILVKRSFRFPMLSAFDLPDNIASCGQRDRTTIPNQGLTLLNNRSIQEQASAFANRLFEESKGNPRVALSLAWKLAFNREIADSELVRASVFLPKGTSNAAQLRAALKDLALAIFNTNEFIYLP